MKMLCLLLFLRILNPQLHAFERLLKLVFLSLSFIAYLEIHVHSALCVLSMLDTFWFVCSNAVAGESALDRMVCGLGGKLVLPMIKEHIMQMLQNRKLCLPRMLA